MLYCKPPSHWPSPCFFIHEVVCDIVYYTLQTCRLLLLRCMWSPCLSTSGTFRSVSGKPMIICCHFTAVCVPVSCLKCHEPCAHCCPWTLPESVHPSPRLYFFTCLIFSLLLPPAPPRWPSVKASASTAEDPGFESCLRWDFFRVESHQWLKNWHSSGCPARHLALYLFYRVSTGTGQPGVSILWLGEVERLISNFYLCVAARKIVWADPSLRYTNLLLGR